MLTVVRVDYFLCNLDDPFRTMTTDLELFNSLNAFDGWPFQSRHSLWVNIFL